MANYYAIKRAWTEQDFSTTLLCKKKKKITSKKCNGQLGELEIDLTDFYKAVITGAKENNGFYLKFDNYLAIDETDSEGRKQAAISYDCDTIKEWAVGPFTSGDISFYNRKVYRCIDGTGSAWCGSAGYEPGTLNGQIPWEEIGDCLDHKVYIYSSDYSETDLRPALHIIFDGVTDISTAQTAFGVKLNTIVTDNQLNIMTAKGQHVTLSLYSIAGEKVQEFSGISDNAGIIVLPLKKLSAGYYLGSMKAGNRDINFRFLLK